MKRPLIALCALLSFFLLTAATRHRSVRSGTPPPVLSSERSFAITDKSILETSFRFERVLDTLAARSNVPGMTAETLYRQWFDTQNPKPGRDPSMPHCDDERTNGQPSLNGFPVACPASAGNLASAPFLPDEFVPIAITNRFDQARGHNCGQYHIAFGKKRSSPMEVFHVIFEATLPNPDPSGNLAACRPVAQFWADLSGVASMDERRKRLEHFFFDGIDGFEPVIHPDHFGAAPAGIRILQDVLPDLLLHFFQYRLVHGCNAASECTLYMKPDVLANTPFNQLFDARIETPKGVAFREQFLQQVKSLAAPDVNLFAIDIDKQFLLADTRASNASIQSSFIGTFQNSLTSPAGMAFRGAIEEEARKAGSTLDANAIIQRAQTRSCDGCHASSGSYTIGDGLKFPAALLEFQHVSDDESVSGEGGVGSRWQISPAMRDVFIPQRMKILSDFLTTGKAPVHSN